MERCRNTCTAETPQTLSKLHRVQASAFVNNKFIFVVVGNFEVDVSIIPRDFGTNVVAAILRDVRVFAGKLHDSQVLKMHTPL